MLRGIISLGLCLFFNPVSSVYAQQGLKPFNLGDVMQQAAQTRAIMLENQRRELQIQQQQLQLEFTQQQQQEQHPPPTASAPQSSLANETMSRFQNAIKFRRYRYEDFDRVVFGNDLQISFDMVALMAESPYAADIAYYLGKHPDKSAAVSRMALP